MSHDLTSGGSIRVTPTGRRRSAEERVKSFWAKVDRKGAGGCWEWTGAKNRDGYGYIVVVRDPLGCRRLLFAHRVAYRLTTGEPIPKEMALHHGCHNRGCVNPDHLEPVTRSDHSRLHHPRLTVCSRGHVEQWEPNGVTRSGVVKRTCAECRRERRRLHAQARRLAAVA
jgi:hypothetical protein